MAAGDYIAANITNSGPRIMMLSTFAITASFGSIRFALSELSRG